MPALPTRYGIQLALLVLGAYSQIAQALLIRENLVVFYGNEICLGAFFGSWLFWIAAGSMAVMRLRARPWIQHPLPIVRSVILLLPFLLAAQLIGTRVVRVFMDISATEIVPLGELFVATSFITLPTSLGLGIAFPLACKGLRDLNARGADHQAITGRTVSVVSRLYIIEALGALLGGVLFTFVLIEWVGIWRSVGVISIVLAATSLALSETPAKRQFIPYVVGLAGLMLAASPVGAWLHRHTEILRFSTLQPGLELLDTVETRYGHVAVARLGKQMSVVTDGHIAQSFPAPRWAEQEAAYYYTQSNGARRVLLFGGLAGGLAEELLRYPVEQLDIIEEDKRAFQQIRPHLPQSTLNALDDPRLRLHHLDGRRFVNRLQGNDNFQLVLVLVADPSSAHSNRYFTREFYENVQRAMSPEGVLCTRVSSASNYLGREVKSYSGSVFRTLSQIFPHVAIAPGDQHVYCASAVPGQTIEDPGVLEQRYLATPLDEHRFPSLSFYSLLPDNRVAFVRGQLTQERGELNTDIRPVTYYLNMVLWGKFSASGFAELLEVLGRMGPWPYLVPLLVLASLMLLRASMEGLGRTRLHRQSATLALVIIGLIAMAVQLTLLFSYQAHVGFMFGRIALLNAVFMTGLAIGAGGLGRHLTHTSHPSLSLALLLALLAAALGVLPSLLGLLSSLDAVWQETIYLMLCTLAGLLTGTGFPLGVHHTHVDTPEVLHTSGITEAADHFGGAIGGLLTGALLVPILGIPRTCHLLAMMALIAMAPVLYGQFAPKIIPSLLKRGQPAFPWQILSWALFFSVLTIFFLSLFIHCAAPGPRVQFDETTLAQVSGSQVFRLETQPIPHYLGQNRAGEEEGSESGVNDTVSLASMTVTSEMRGYAGPLNLLVSIDKAGVLRGVRYVDSNETPSYIADIDHWLAGLAGFNLATNALSLDHIDALSGATLSSRAALQSINHTAQVGGRLAFSKVFAVSKEDGPQKVDWWSAQFLLTLLLIISFFPVYFSGKDGLRLVYQAAVLVVLGFTFNTLVTEVDLINLCLGHFSALTSNPQRWLLLGFVLMTALFYGQAYCGYVCPFGALQEFLSRLGRLLYLRNYPQRDLETHMRYIKFILLALMLMAVWVTGEVLWASFNPMQHFFGGKLSGWIGVITVISLTGALVYYRFWCRYFCPFGAFLALSNKLAVFRRFAPQRRFEHCDLGVREEYDVDCIHCHRCITAKDYGIRPRGES